MSDWDMDDIISTAIVYIAIFAIIIAAGAIISVIHVDWTTGKGTGSDTVFSIEKSGFLWKRYEIWFTNDHTTMYCTQDEDIATALRYSMLNKTKVTFKFEDKFLVLDWDCSSNTYITEVQQP